MKIFLVILVTGAFLGAYLLSPRYVMAQTQSSAANKVESPFACNRTALNIQQRARQKALMERLRSIQREIRELENGYEFELPSDSSTFQAAAEWITMERACCPFFDFNLRLERGQGKSWLRLTGRDGVKAFIQSEFHVSGSI